MTEAEAAQGQTTINQKGNSGGGESDSRGSGSGNSDRGNGDGNVAAMTAVTAAPAWGQQ